MSLNASSFFFSSLTIWDKDESKDDTNLTSSNCDWYDALIHFTPKIILYHVIDLIFLIFQILNTENLLEDNTLSYMRLNRLVCLCHTTDYVGTKCRQIHKCSKFASKSMSNYCELIDSDKFSK